MTGPRLAADVLADSHFGSAPAMRSLASGFLDALLAGADMVALVRTDAGVEVRGLVGGMGLSHSLYRLVDAPVPAQEDDRG